jgi:tRNA threonylcarbamoyladenosine biosynthesis protein TsaB
VKLLALSTSASRGSAAFLETAELAEAADAFRHRRVSSSRAYADLAGHAERIFEAISDVTTAAGQAPATISAVACDVGPGSFTGIRVGVASAKGIALALGIPVYGVCSLHAMAAAAFETGAAGPDDVVFAVMDAKRGEVFLAAFDASGVPVVASHAVLTSQTIRPVPAYDGRHSVVVGEVASRLNIPDDFRIIHGAELDFPSAAWIAELALPRALRREPADAALLEANYLRAPDVTLARRDLSPSPPIA